MFDFSNIHANVVWQWYGNSDITFVLSLLKQNENEYYNKPPTKRIIEQKIGNGIHLSSFKKKTSLIWMTHTEPSSRIVAGMIHRWQFYNKNK